MRILVTGGAGYIGSHTVRALLEAGHEPIVVDSLENGHREAVPNELLLIGHLEVGMLRSLFSRQRFDAVIHFAGYIEARESAREPGKYYVNNVALTLDLLECMRQSGVSRLVFSSSAGVYGRPLRVPIPENEPSLPINPYAATKAMVERILADYHAAHGLRSIALRYFNAAGADPKGDLGEAHRSESHLVPRVLRVALGLESQLRVFGLDHPTSDGTCIRDFIHVSDLARAHVLALEALVVQDGARVYNVGSGRGYSVRQVIDACSKVTGRTIPWEAAPRFDGDPPVLVADASLAGAALGWQPRLSQLESIVETAWRWHSTHPRGFAA
jgi:UDP-glucose 4-epimerase